MAMSSTSKAWMVAASIGAVEALKDQIGFCSQAKSLAPSSAALVSNKLKEAQQAEDSLKKVMYLNCWGPS
ncbi:unnamed protein product [Linum tenue]|uniref:Uncharacterized protein n=1 Tax=Linum tenue TaxID=586396 RepID=A0AAV0NQ78_9ROSI|nr:unnamed protein product [Linum tenue]